MRGSGGAKRRHVCRGLCEVSTCSASCRARRSSRPRSSPLSALSASDDRRIVRILSLTSPCLLVNLPASQLRSRPPSSLPQCSPPSCSPSSPVLSVSFVVAYIPYVPSYQYSNGFSSAERTYPVWTGLVNDFPRPCLRCPRIPAAASGHSSHPRPPLSARLSFQVPRSLGTLPAHLDESRTMLLCFLYTTYRRLSVCHALLAIIPPLDNRLTRNL